MKRTRASLAHGLLVLGLLMILAGLAWGLRIRLMAPPRPVIGEAGAVVVAETAPRRPTATREQPTPSPTPSPSAAPQATAPPLPVPMEGPTPEILPEWPALPEPMTTPVAMPTETAIPPTPSLTVVPTASQPPTRIVAPAIGLDAKVVPMGWEMVDRQGKMISEWVVPSKAAGWHANSGLPGQGENIVLSGHHNIEGKVFRYVVDLKPGDEITLYVGDTPYLYTVTEKYILKEAGMPLAVRQQNAQWIMPTGDERLTLVTCWPYEWPGNTHRVIVIAMPPEYFLTYPNIGQ